LPPSPDFTFLAYDSAGYIPKESVDSGVVVTTNSIEKESPYVSVKFARQLSESSRQNSELNEGNLKMYVRT
jgi:hypothetical protein